MILKIEQSHEYLQTRICKIGTADELLIASKS